MEIFKRFAPITKVDDEQRMVYGYASTEALDSQGEVVERSAIIDALPEYMRFANIREMHTMSAVGVAKAAEVDDRGLYIGAKVVDDTAWVKVKEGVYKGFSIGGRALEKSDGIIKRLRLTEISLVDRPANPECVIDAWKADTLAEEGQPTAKSDDAPVAAPETATPQVPDRFASLRKAAEGIPYNEGKPIWDAQRALAAMGAIFELLSSESYEAEQEPGQQASLRAAIQSLKDFVIAELQERVENGTAVSMGDVGGDVNKVGARYSKATKEALAKVHGMLRECDKTMTAMGYDKADDDMDGKADQGADVAKAADALAKAEADLAKAVQERDELAKRIKELESQPEPAKAAMTAVEKSGDTNGNLVVAEQSQPNPNDPLSMFKAALSRPLVVGAPISKPSSVN